MLDRNELLPEEQIYPDIVEKLRAVYQMKPEEEQVLLRVRERLAQSSHTLPLLAPIQVDEYAEQHLVSPSVPPSSIVKARWKWSRLFNMLAAALVVALLVGSLAAAFILTDHTKVGSPPGTANDIRVVLAAEKGSQPTMAEMEATATLLLQRFRAFGLQGAQAHVMTEKGRLEILAILPHFGGDEQRIVNMLVERGSLAFWNTGSIPLALGAAFNPAQFVRDNPGGKPLFINKDLDLGTLTIIHDVAGRPQFTGMMQGDVINRFSSFTAGHVGDYLTITLDSKVVESAVIQSAITGPFILTFNYTEQQAKAFMAIIKHGPLPVELQRVS